VPELPEIEHLRRTLGPLLVGRHVRAARLLRRDVAHAERRVSARDLLAGGVVRDLWRHGKQLAIAGDSGRVVCVHLGMSGQLRHLPPRSRIPDPTHVHCVWSLCEPDGAPAGRLLFRDPRRFGGIWVFPSRPALAAARWDRLGPDALAIDAGELGRRLGRTGRAVKAVLLDQAVVAGIGNIYADEALFEAGIHPLTPARRIPDAGIGRLAAAIRATLEPAIAAGGSTLRDYVDARGREGAFVRAHRVYGRAGEPCLRCGRSLERADVAQRTTVWCPACQRALPPVRRMGV
jgi:formamidopyrimidine-DNA glycosylase